MTGKDILLSICISSYNRGKLCTELVHNILKIQDDRYNIFICDDCSDDSEFAELLTMQNDKVSLIRNVKNKGACPNWYQTINCGDGQYILHILDRDQIFVDYIIYLLEILENSLIAGGYVGISAMSLTHTVGGNTDYERQRCFCGNGWSSCSSDRVSGKKRVLAKRKLQEIFL